MKEKPSFKIDKKMAVGDDSARKLITIALNQMNDMQNYRAVVITNIPQEIDPAIRRRVGFSFCMRLPNFDEKKELFCKLFNDDSWKIDTNFSYSQFNTTMNLFSGDDMLKLAQVMCRDKVRGSLNFPLRNNTSPFNNTDLNTTLIKVKATATPEDLKKIAEYAAEFSNPCFTEYLNPTKSKRVLDAWDLNNPNGQTPTEYGYNNAYKVMINYQKSWLSDADERYFQALNGKPSTSYCTPKSPVEPDDKNSFWEKYSVFIFVGIGVVGLLLVGTIIIVISLKFKKENDGYQHLEPVTD